MYNQHPCLNNQAGSVSGCRTYDRDQDNFTFKLFLFFIAEFKYKISETSYDINTCSLMMSFLGCIRKFINFTFSCHSILILILQVDEMMNRRSDSKS